MHARLHRNLPELELHFSVIRQTIDRLQGDQIWLMLVNDPQNVPQIRLFTPVQTVADIETHHLDLHSLSRPGRDQRAGQTNY
jgi:hypothetical protein